MSAANGSEVGATPVLTVPFKTAVLEGLPVMLITGAVKLSEPEPVIACVLLELTRTLALHVTLEVPERLSALPPVASRTRMQAPL